MYVCMYVCLSNVLYTVVHVPVASTSETDLPQFQKWGVHFSGQEMIVYASTCIPPAENMGVGLSQFTWRGDGMYSNMSSPCFISGHVHITYLISPHLI